MTALAALIFVVVLGITLISLGLSTQVLEGQRRRRVASLLKTAADGAAPAPQSAVLVQRYADTKSRIQKLAAGMNVGRRAGEWLQQSGMPWTLGRLLMLTCVAALFGALVGLKIRILFDTALSSLAFACIFAAMPWGFVRAKRRKRLAEFEQEFPEALDFLARAVKAGHALPVSLEMLSRESPEPVQSEFRRVYNEQKLGESLNVTLRHLGERIPLVDVRFFVSAVLMQRETGGNLGEILTKLSHVIRERFRLKGQVRAVSAHGRITATVLTILPVFTILGLMATGPEYLKVLVKEPSGKYMILAAVVFQVLGYFTMKKIINIKV